ncbi:MAG: hypothetical protein LIO63_04870 [Akkermansia sp.]|nr:hypothetical protein [Akkermansia sp.]
MRVRVALLGGTALLFPLGWAHTAALALGLAAEISTTTDITNYKEAEGDL